MPLRPEVYGNLLGKKIMQTGAVCWLINTGWIGGAYGVGKRIPLKDTRLILQSILNNDLNEVNFRTDEQFKFQVPVELDGISSEILFPQMAWANESDFLNQAEKVRGLFVSNFKKFYEHVDIGIRRAAQELDF